MNGSKFFVAFATSLLFFVGSVYGQPPGGGGSGYVPASGTVWDNWIDGANLAPAVSYSGSAKYDLIPDTFVTGDLSVVNLESTFWSNSDFQIEDVGPYPDSDSGLLNFSINTIGGAANLSGGSTALFSGDPLFGPVSFHDSVGLGIPSVVNGIQVDCRGTARNNPVAGGNDVKARVVVENPKAYDLKVRVYFLGKTGGEWSAGWDQMNDGETTAATRILNATPVLPKVGGYYDVQVAIRRLDTNVLVFAGTVGKAYIE